MPCNRRKGQDGISANGRNLFSFRDGGGWVYVENCLVVQGNPPEFFDLVGEVFAVEEMNHPVAALVAALQQEEFTPLLVVQLNNVKRGCGGTEISETNG